VTSVVMEFGPRMAFTSAFSSNAVSICQACDIPVVRLEVSRRYRCRFQWPRGDATSTAATSTTTQMRMMQVMKSFLHDRMTEEEYTTPLSSFDQSIIPTPTKTIPIMEYGRKALEEINDEMGLGFDDFDLDYYTDLFQVCVVVFVPGRRVNQTLCPVALFAISLSHSNKQPSSFCKIHCLASTPT
jgi:phosphoribosylformylglycinamidine synthase